MRRLLRFRVILLAAITVASGWGSWVMFTSGSAPPPPSPSPTSVAQSSSEALTSGPALGDLHTLLSAVEPVGATPEPTPAPAPRRRTSGGSGGSSGGASEPQPSGNPFEDLPGGGPIEDLYGD